MPKFLAVFTTVDRGAVGVYNVDFTTPEGLPTIEGIRHLEQVIKERQGAQVVALTNIIPLAD